MPAAERKPVEQPQHVLCGLLDVPARRLRRDREVLQVQIEVEIQVALRVVAVHRGDGAVGADHRDRGSAHDRQHVAVLAATQNPRPPLVGAEHLLHAAHAAAAEAERLLVETEAVHLGPVREGGGVVERLDSDPPLVVVHGTVQPMAAHEDVEPAGEPFADLPHPVDLGLVHRDALILELLVEVPPTAVGLGDLGQGHPGLLRDDLRLTDHGLQDPRCRQAAGLLHVEEREMITQAVDAGLGDQGELLALDGRGPRHAPPVEAQPVTRLQDLEKNLGRLRFAHWSSSTSARSRAWARQFAAICRSEHGLVDQVVRIG